MATDTVETILDAQQIVNSLEEKPDRLVIFDTDWCIDFDDVLALQALMFAEKIGVWDVLGCVSSAYTPWNSSSIQAICAEAGHTNMPVSWTEKNMGSGLQYQTEIVEKALADGVPITAGVSEHVMESTDHYRQMLAYAIEDGRPVTLITVGNQTALYNLMVSPADNNGDGLASGLDLIIAANAELFFMGGNYPSGAYEYNVAQDQVASKYIVDNFPNRMLAVDGSMGSVLCGSNLHVDAPDSLLFHAIKSYSEHNTDGRKYTLYTGRNAWDPVTVMCAAYGWDNLDKANFELNTGNFYAGSNYPAWADDVNGKDGYVRYKDTVDWFSEALNLMVNPNTKAIGLPVYPGYTKANGGSPVISFPARGRVLGQHDVWINDTTHFNESQKITDAWLAEDIGRTIGIGNPGGFDADSFPIWPNRITGREPLVQPDFTKMPKYVADVDGNGTPGIQLNGAGLRSLKKIQLSQKFGVFFKIYIPTDPAGVAQTLLMIGDKQSTGQPATQHHTLKTTLGYDGIATYFDMIDGTPTSVTQSDASKPTSGEWLYCSLWNSGGSEYVELRYYGDTQSQNVGYTRGRESADYIHIGQDIDNLGNVVDLFGGYINQVRIYQGDVSGGSFRWHIYGDMGA